MTTQCGRQGSAPPLKVACAACFCGQPSGLFCLVSAVRPARGGIRQELSCAVVRQWCCLPRLLARFAVGSVVAAVTVDRTACRVASCGGILRHNLRFCVSHSLSPVYQVCMRPRRGQVLCRFSTRAAVPSLCGVPPTSALPA